ncbi:MAG: hypothetical protein EXS27_06005 [Pedosphaera sp.]|nr:hypothetical protein [Pedosphaera sp.]
MKKAGLVLTAFVTLLVACVLGMQSCQRKGWEAMLRGPFHGDPYDGAITNAAVSWLHVSPAGRLEIHEFAGLTAPVLVLRSEDGSVRWSRLLLPERKHDNGTVERAGVRDLKLREWEKRETGYCIRMTCDLDLGGPEAGLIDLNNDFGFESFRISW